MKRCLIVIILALSCGFSLNCLGQLPDIKMKGAYYGQNLYILNPRSDSGYCVVRAYVNQDSSMTEVRSNAFEIDFSLLKLKQGDSVSITLRHKPGCTPVIINPEALSLHDMVSFNAVKIDRNGNMDWSVAGDPGSDLFVVEQFRWNKWVTAARIRPLDSIHWNSYRYKVRPHSGINTFRLKFTNKQGVTAYSPTAKYRASFKPLTITSDKVVNILKFSGETMYEIYDNDGHFIREGYGELVMIYDLPLGKYYVNFDNQTLPFQKK